MFGILRMLCCMFDIVLLFVYTDSQTTRTGGLVRNMFILKEKNSRKLDSGCCPHPNELTVLYVFILALLCHVRLRI